MLSRSRWRTEESLDLPLRVAPPCGVPRRRLSCWIRHPSRQVAVSIRLLTGNTLAVNIGAGRVSRLPPAA